jgi:hypothetical protein
MWLEYIYFLNLKKEKGKIFIICIECHWRLLFQGPAWLCWKEQFARKADLARVPNTLFH